VHLERTEDDAIMAVAVVSGCDRLLAPTHPATYRSPELRGVHDIESVGLVITRDPATVGLRPLIVIAGDVRSAGVRSAFTNGTPSRPLLERAGVAGELRSLGTCLVLADPTAERRVRLDGGRWINGRGEPLATEQRGGGYCHDDSRRPIGPVEIRPGGRVISVR
jgi:hypothetical protein